MNTLIAMTFLSLLFLFAYAIDSAIRRWWWKREIKRLHEQAIIHTRMLAYALGTTTKAAIYACSAINELSVLAKKHNIRAEA